MKRASSNAPAGLNVKKITAYLKGQAKNRNAVRITSMPSRLERSRPSAVPVSSNAANSKTTGR